jgi:ketosteroid isomerase-like protein
MGRTHRCWDRQGGREPATRDAGKTSGAGVAWSYWVVFTFRDGKVLSSEWFSDRREALEAAGLAEW